MQSSSYLVGGEAPGSCSAVRLRRDPAAVDLGQPSSGTDSTSSGMPMPRDSSLSLPSNAATERGLVLGVVEPGAGSPPRIGT